MPAKEEYTLKEQAIFITDTISIFKLTLPNSKYNCYWLFYNNKNNITISNGALLWTRPLFSAVEQVIPFTVSTLLMRILRPGKSKKLRCHSEHVSKVRNGCRKSPCLCTTCHQSVTRPSLCESPFQHLETLEMFPKWPPGRPLEGHWDRVYSMWGTYLFFHVELSHELPELQNIGQMPTCKIPRLCLRNCNQI